MCSLARCYQSLGKLAEAESLLTQVLEARRRAPGPDHPDTLWAMHDLAACYQSQRKLDRAEPLLVAALDGRIRALGRDHPATLESMERLGVVRSLQRRYAEAEPVLRECWTLRKRTSPDNWAQFHTESLLGAALLGRKQYAAAEPVLLSAYQGMKAREKMIPPAFRLHLTEARRRIGQLYNDWGKPDQADRWREGEPSSVGAEELPSDPFAPL
jgi:hypothetical protein